MATVKRDFKKLTLKIKDGGANFLEVVFGEGNLQYTQRRNIEYAKNRGSLTGMTVRQGDEELVDVSFQAVFDYYKGIVGGVTIHDALTKDGGASGWASSDTADVCAPYAVDLSAVLDNNCGTNDVETLTFSDFRYEEIQFDERAGTISVTGKATGIASVRSTTP